MCGCVDVWMCGCVGVHVDVQCFDFSLFSSLLSSCRGSRFWAGIAHASCVLVPGVVMSTVSCRYSGFGCDHDVSPHFLLHPFLSLFAKSFLLAVTTSCILLLHYSFSFLPFFSFFAESLLFQYFLFICVPIPGLFGLHSLPCHWTCSVRSVCEFK